MRRLHCCAVQRETQAETRRDDTWFTQTVPSAATHKVIEGGIVQLIEGDKLTPADSLHTMTTRFRTELQVPGLIVGVSPRKEGQRRIVAMSGPVGRKPADSWQLIPPA